MRTRAGQRIGVMDIGAAQWRFQRIGQLSRIELKLMQGIDHGAFKTALAQELRGQYLVTETRIRKHVLPTCHAPIAST